MMLRLVRFFGWLLFVLLLVVFAGVLYARKVSNPVLSGTLTLRGLKGEVSIVRDRWGVPHIRAQASDEDALYALGFVHAQDRMWQMEFQRRVAQGRLSEVLGAAALPKDKFLRTWGFYRAAQAALPALSARSRSLISAYTAGVNAGIAQDRLPLEFRLMRYRPERWTDVDSIAWSKLMAYDLGGNWDDELTGQRVLSKLGAAGLNAVLPPYPANAPTILSSQELNLPSVARPTPAPLATSSLPADALRQLHAQLAAAASLGFINAPGKGSNDWVIGGQRTQSGKPILADDPHLSLSAPMLWYLADIQGPTLHAIGASIPGLPGIVIGRNDHIAWGVTNVNPDVQDLFIEPAGARLQTRTEVIKVKGQPPVNYPVQTSAHGPVVASSSDWQDGQQRAVTLQWTALEDGDTTFDSFLGLNYAQNWKQFTAALSSYVAPSQNFVYADTAGNIGYYAPGRVPIRTPGWDGSLPVPDDSAHRWTGYIPFAQLPHVLNPTDGLVVTANNKVTPDSYKPFLANNRVWAEPYRAERILQRLDTGKPLTLDDVASTQLDTVSLVWKGLEPYLLQTQPKDDLSRTALDLLRGWDGNETLSSVQASVFEAWLMKLEEMAQDEVPDVRLTSFAVLNQLKTGGALCRNASANLGSCADELAASLQAATTDLSKRMGTDPSAWAWEKLHSSLSAHGAFGSVGAIAWIWNRGIATPGGTNTVDVARPDSGTFHQTHAPSYRQIIDLSDMNRSRFIGTLGQGGNPIGSHYADMQPMWRGGQYIPMSSQAQDWGDTLTLNAAP
ncbi:penicillin acylase family protein [Deinococcus ruber]|uniref:Penicillin amidase n=1 Tax=Deinococcus ruber TaxID=1848197 RepID=A0A918C2K9_9DEIO|nr:penicillin acylase family protein [Deinococcus ruber]GGR02559.1 penicillin amidase [Deinococcus ruber]